MTDNATVVYECPELSKEDLPENMVSENEGRLRADSIKDRLSPDIRAVIDERLPPVGTTVIALVTCPRCKTDFAGGDRSKHRTCKYFSQVVDLENGEVSDGDIQRFERLVTYMIEKRMVDYGVLADPLCIPLKNGRAILAWYVFSDHTREELNEQLGCESFVEDGELYEGDWPQVAVG